MRPDKKIFVALSLLLLLVLTVSTGRPEGAPLDLLYQGEGACPRPADDDAAWAGCTIFVIVAGDRVLFGNNVDDGNPNTYYWVEPGYGNNAGVVYLGFGSEPQGGINEKGLAFDTNGLSPAPLNPHPERGPAPRNPVDNLKRMMREAGTVAEAIVIANSRNWGTSLNKQYFLADANGDAAVLSAGADGELAVTRKQPGSGYLISTNFNRATDQGTVAPCWRYNTVAARLDPFTTAGNITVDDVVSILDEVHQEGVQLPAGKVLTTQYSNIFDLRSGDIFVYYRAQFDEVVQRTVAGELANGAQRSTVRDLFSSDLVQRADADFVAQQRRLRIWTVAGQLWLVLVALAVARFALDLLYRRLPPGSPRLRWLPVLVLLGPFGLLAYVVATRRARLRPETATAVYASALGAAGYGVALLLALGVALALLEGADLLLRLPALYAIALVAGLLLVHGRALFRRRVDGRPATVADLLPRALLATNVALAAMIPTLFLLLQRSGVNSDLGNPITWLQLGLTATAGALVLLPLQRRWVTTIAEEGAAATRPVAPAPLPTGLHRYRAWGLLLASFVAMLASLLVTLQLSFRPL